MHLPRLFTKAVAQGTTAGAAEAAGARVAKPLAARAELEGKEIKKLAEGAPWRWGEPADETCRQGGTGLYRQVTITEKGWGGGRGRPTSPSPPIYMLGLGGGGGTFDHLAKCA